MPIPTLGPAASPYANAPATSTSKRLPRATGDMGSKASSQVAGPEALFRLGQHPPVRVEPANHLAVSRSRRWGGLHTATPDARFMRRASADTSWQPGVINPGTRGGCARRCDTGRPQSLSGVATIPPDQPRRQRLNTVGWPWRHELDMGPLAELAWGRLGPSSLKRRLRLLEVAAAERCESNDCGGEADDDHHQCSIHVHPYRGHGGDMAVRT